MIDFQPPWRPKTVVESMASALESSGPADRNPAAMKAIGEGLVGRWPDLDAGQREILLALVAEAATSREDLNAVYARLGRTLDPECRVGPRLAADRQRANEVFTALYVCSPAMKDDPSKAFGGLIMTAAIEGGRTVGDLILSAVSEAAPVAYVSPLHDLHPDLDRMGASGPSDGTPGAGWTHGVAFAGSDSNRNYKFDPFESRPLPETDIAQLLRQTVIFHADGTNGHGASSGKTLLDLPLPERLTIPGQPLSAIHNEGEPGDPLSGMTHQSVSRYPADDRPPYRAFTGRTDLGSWPEGVPIQSVRNLEHFISCVKAEPARFGVASVEAFDTFVGLYRSTNEVTAKPLRKMVCSLEVALDIRMDANGVKALKEALSSEPRLGLPELINRFSKAPPYPQVTKADSASA